MRIQMPGSALLRRLLRTRPTWVLEVEPTTQELEHMIPYLKIKIKSLAYEARIIRQMERRQKKNKKVLDQHPETGEFVTVPNPKYRPLPVSLEACTDDAERNRFKLFWGLREHRLGLRKQSRTSGLAYGFLRGLKYLSMESQAHEKPNWDAIEKEAVRFGADEREVKQKYAAWLAEAKEYFAWQKENRPCSG